LLTGDAAATDPVCSLSPRHHELASFVESIQQSEASETETGLS
jgi:hypothetical protein